jgi:tRNA A-37 threonylcarbamoyl transferase component Bud32
VIKEGLYYYKYILTQLHFVNWQRDVSIELLGGIKVVIKRNKPLKDFHEYLLITTYTLISILLAHPDRPPLTIGHMSMKNESFEMRKYLRNIGIPTPSLISITNKALIEEYIEGGDLYRAFSKGKESSLAFQAGSLTGKMHAAGCVFTDNKAENYLLDSQNLIIRTDLGFIQRNGSQFSRSMDIGSFLASVMDLRRPQYRAIEAAFLNGYKSETDDDVPYLSLVLRNILTLGFSSDQPAMFQNMIDYKR